MQYHVVLSVGPGVGDDTVASMRDRMALLNMAMMRVIRGVEDFAITFADYAVGCVELDVWTTRVHGLTEGRVQVSVTRVQAAA